MYPVLLEAQRIRLREFEDRDLEGILRVYGDPVATRQLSFEPRTRDQVATFLANSARRAREEPRVEYALAVAFVDTDEVIGSSRLAVGEHRSGQLGLALRADRWGEGLGLEAGRLLLDLGFLQLGLHRLWGARGPDNVQSERLVHKLGMVEEGRIRDHVFVRGAWRDSIVHSILEHECSGVAAPR
ncbi:MAG: GNAT family N-acetyltransferase [Egibacteraceae bacterium]